MDLTNLATIVVVSRQSRRRESLRSMLKVLPQVRAVYSAQDQHTGQSLINYYQPAVTLIDGDVLLQEAAQYLKNVKNCAPHTRCILLAHQPPSEDLIRVEGADCILFDGFPSFRLIEAVQSLMVPQA